MTQLADAATEAFVATARADLQRQLARSGWVDEMTVDQDTDGVVISAVVVVAADRLEIRGRGETLVAAYGELIRTVPTPILNSAFRQLVVDRGR